MDPPPGPDPAPATEPATRRRGWAVPVILLGALLVGAAGATAAIVVADRWAPSREFTAAVLLKDAITDEQRAAVRAAVDDLDGVEDVRYDSRTATFIAGFTTPVFECEILLPLVKVAGIDRVAVTRQAADGSPSAEVNCGLLQFSRPGGRSTALRVPFEPSQDQ